jgi:UDP-N-acetylmuramoyl-tripeptide--D-alanyl-D-alanine ligase
MKNFDLKFVMDAVKGQLLSQHHQSFSGIGTDTRKDLSGQLFIALKGEQFDAHKFLSTAAQQGAAGLLIHQWPQELEDLKKTVTVIEVPDTLVALQKLAQAVRRKLKTKVIALTGSNGKTTTKEFTAAILETKRRVHYSKGSFNNHWGLPFSLLELEPQHEVAVLEMGMNHAQEITRLVEIAEPDIVVCTTVGTAHMEHFGSPEGIAKAKEEIYEFSPRQATRIYNIDNPFTQKMWQRGQSRFKDATILTFSNTNPKADLFLQFVSMGLDEIAVKGQIAGIEGQVRVPVFGRQNMVNLAAAGALALAAGMEPKDIWKGFENCRTNWGRNQLLELKSGAKMIFDGYNANPDSMKALVDNVKNIAVKGRKIGVFGEMLELGDFSAGFHQEIAEVIGQAGFDSIYFVGADAEAFRRGLRNVGNGSKQTIWNEFRIEMADELMHEAKSGDLVVVKGSRGMKLERFVVPCEPLGFSLKKE